jgi:hypothetical protein
MPEGYADGDELGYKGFALVIGETYWGVRVARRVQKRDFLAVGNLYPELYTVNAHDDDKMA